MHIAVSSALSAVSVKGELCIQLSETAKVHWISIRPDKSLRRLSRYFILINLQNCTAENPNGLVANVSRKCFDCKKMIFFFKLKEDIEENFITGFRLYFIFIYRGACRPGSL